MPIQIESHLNMRELNAELTILPLHAKAMNKPLTLHRSFRDLCLIDYPHAYSYYKYKEQDGLERGDFIFLDRIDSTKVGIMIARGDIRRKFDLYAIAKALRSIREMDLHNKYSIAFPALGYYEEDKIDIKRVFKMVEKFLGDGDKSVYFVLNY